MLLCSPVTLTDIVKHQIITGSGKPIKRPPRRLPLSKYKLMVSNTGPGNIGSSHHSYCRTEVEAQLLPYKSTPFDIYNRGLP